jgi:putative ABC transport system permease protein
VRFRDQMRAARHTFAANRGRTGLTLLGIMIGAGSIVLLVSLLKGGEEALVKTEQHASDSDIVEVDADEAPAKDARKTRKELGIADNDALEDSPLLPGASVTSEKTRWTKALYGKKRKRVSLVGAEPIALKLYRLGIERGRFINDDDVKARARVCVVGINVYEQLLEKPESLDGMKVTVDGARWEVVGVLKNKPPLGGGGDGPWMWNNKILVPQATFDSVYNNQHLVDQIFVRVGESDQPMASRLAFARKVIQSTLIRRHYGVSNFKIDRWAEEAKQEEMIMSIIKVLLLGTGLLSLFVGGINIMNIMLVTVRERTREIGVRRAVGASPGAILGQFLLEAALIAMLGGIIGVVGGMLLAWLAALGLTAAIGEWNLHIEAWSIALGIGLSVMTGIAFGMLPAMRAAKLDPVEALRYE